MTTHDNAPPPDEWRPEPRDNVYTLPRLRPQEMDEPHIVRGEN